MFRKRPRVLIVEDEPTCLQVFARLFEQHGFEALRADSVAAALERLTPNLDLLWLDLMLPDGDGTEVLAEVRRRQYGFPTVVSTAAATLGVEALQTLKPEHVFPKPYPFDALMSLAAKIMAGFKPVREVT